MIQLRRSLIFITAAVISLSLQAEPARPFLWKDGLRKGEVFSDSRLPYRFVTPDDLVFRIWKEGTFFRLEARSYRGEDTQIAMTALKIIRQPAMQELQAELTIACHPDTTELKETATSLQIQCQLPDSVYILRIVEVKKEADTTILTFFEVASRDPMTPASLSLQYSENFIRQ